MIIISAPQQGQETTTEPNVGCYVILSTVAKLAQKRKEISTDQKRSLFDKIRYLKVQYYHTHLYLVLTHIRRPHNTNQTRLWTSLTCLNI